jgi:hypothetical protein
MEPKFDTEVELVGEDGNAFAIMGKVSRAIRKAGGSEEDVKVYQEEAMSGDYNNLLQVTMKTVHII